MARSTRTTTTLLFTDIEGSARQWEESPLMFDRVEQHFEVLRSVIDAAGGAVFAMLGDGVAAAFPSAADGVGAAVTAQRDLEQLGLSVRMGLHTGEVERAGDDLRGRAVNRAARIMGVGHGGQVLLSDVTATLARSGPVPVELVDLGPHRLRDLAEPERLWQVRHPALRATFPPLRGLDSFAHNLPAQRSSLVGRERELEAIRVLLGERRTVTLTGVGGVGKTRLALHAAAEVVGHVPNVWFVGLAATMDPDDVAGAIAAAIGVAGADDPLLAVTSLVSGQPTLLVVDNCEHLVDRVASVLDTLTMACAGLRVLATSREPLGIDGEHVVPVRPLPASTSASALLRERAEAAGADLAGESDETIEALCHRLDGLPLAIELAAARVPTLGLSGVINALDEGAELGHAARRRGDARHGTLRATLEWSHRLLDPAEQRLFRRLAVFPNGFELDAVVHVARSTGLAAGDATDHLESLVSRSMVVAEPTAHGVRYRLLETMRAFALELLGQSGERAQARWALADWVADLSGTPPHRPCTADVERRSIRLEREADSWREAALVAAEERSVQLAGRLCGPPAAFFLLGRHDLADVVAPLLDCGPDPAARRAVLCAMVVSASSSTEAATLGAWASEVQAIDDHDPTGLGSLMRWVALAWKGDFARSIDVCVAASRDERLDLTVRHLFVGIAVLDHFSLTGATEDRDDLVERAVDVAASSESALARVLCHLGVAWALIESDPSSSIERVRLALDDVQSVPALTRMALPGSASRLLSRLDPSVAAAALLEQLDAGTGRRRSFVDLVPLLYGAELLERVGASDALPSLPTVPARPHAPTLSMMDFVDLARRASVAGSSASMQEFETTVRLALVEVAGGGRGRDDAA